MAQDDWDKKRLKRLIRKNKYLAYILLGAVGVGLILYATYVGEKSGWYAVAMGIGTGIVATVVGFLILLLLLPDESANEEKIKELEKWGIEKIYSERMNIKIAQKNIPTENLDFIAFGLSHFVKANQVEKITAGIRKGLRVRILVPLPSARVVKEQQQVENNDGIAREIRNLIRWVKEIEEKVKEGEKRGSIELRFYDSNPLGFYCRADGKVYAGPYLPGGNSGQVITYEYSRYSKGGNYYANIFENIWKEEAQVKLIESEKEYLFGNQEEAIKKVLEYFCECMQGACVEAVIGVVVIFKGDQRRTFFSCNKHHQENHKCHGKMDGLVGLMCELNKSCKDGQVSVWRDYKNKITAVHTCLERSTKTIKGEQSIEKFKEDETIGILTVPLSVNEELIGAVTFDFAEYTDLYKADLKNLQVFQTGAELDREMEVCKYFSLAGICAEIVLKMLGQDIKIQYKDLFNERWVS